MPEAATSLAADALGSAELPRGRPPLLPRVWLQPRAPGSSPRGHTVSLPEFCSLQESKVFGRWDSSSLPRLPQPCARSRTTALHEPRAASSGSSPSSHLLTSGISFIFHITHGTAKGMHPSRRAGLQSEVASISRRGVHRGTAIPPLRHSRLRLRLHGEWGFTSEPQEFGPWLPAAGPVLPAVDRRFSCPQRERPPLCRRVPLPPRRLDAARAGGRELPPARAAAGGGARGRLLRGR